ncbi:MAG TPA: sulfotransferase [Candidatus Scalindua sp.]|nr:sulfotransferase [Candidatus Scalindua sp.]
MNRSWNKLKLEIEKRRSSNNVFWKVLVFGKDLVWKLFSPTFYYEFKNRKLFQNIKTYCMFICYPRTGSTLMESLLDAHPNIIIAHELNALKYVQKGFRRNQLYYLLLNNSRNFTKERRGATGYSYEVLNQWQGRFKNLEVIGDKKALLSIKILHSHPELFKKLKDLVRVRIKFIHVIRNPYDTITTSTRAGNQVLKKVTSSDIKKTIDWHFSLVKMVDKLKKELDSKDIIEIRHESFIKNPKLNLKKMCAFLGVEASDDYLNDCASIVYKSPHKSRYDIKWTPELIRLVKKKINKFDFLKGYSYDK